MHLSRMKQAEPNSSGTSKKHILLHLAAHVRLRERLPRLRPLTCHDSCSSISGPFLSVDRNGPSMCLEPLRCVRRTNRFHPVFSGRHRLHAFEKMSELLNICCMRFSLSFAPKVAKLTGLQNKSNMLLMTLRHSSTIPKIALYNQ